MKSVRPATASRTATRSIAALSNLVLGSTLGGLWAPHALAQEAAASEHRTTLEEVVVTSRRREESLQDVPIAVSAFSAESISRNMIEGVEDYFARTPNVSYTTEGSRDRKKLSIRGVTEFITEAGEATVPANTFGIYLDEFSVATATSNPGVMDIERIEVLRGPQGTYFGRNAVGGAINITTKKPTNDLFAEFSADFSRYNTYDLAGTLNLPLIDDKLAVRANVKYVKSDGYIKNINPIGGGNDSEYKYGRLNVRYTPNDRFTLDLVASDSDEMVGMREGVPSGVMSAFTTSLYGPVADPDGIGFWPKNTNRVNFNRPQDVGSEYQYITGRMEYRFDTVRVTSVTGYLESKTFLRGDVDGGSQDLFYEHKPYDRDALSQELRVQSIDGKVWDWTIGAIYSRDRGSVDQATMAGDAMPFGLPSGFQVTRNLGDDKTVGTALFGEAVWHVSQKLDLLLGVRATQDKVDVSETTFTAGDARLSVTAGDKFEDVSPKFTASYQLADHSKVYATVSKGFKSGGVQVGTTLVDQSYDPEQIWNYEVGLKSDFLDGRMRLNAAAFYMDWQDLQASFAVATVDDAGTIVFESGIQNAAAATNYGMEAELSLLVTDDLLVNVAGGYLHAKFDNFTNAYVDGAIVDLSGRRMLNAPEWTASADAQYSFPVINGYEGFARLEWFYRDSVYNDLASLVHADEGFPYKVPSFDNVNFRIGMEGERFSVTAYIENLFDAKYFTNVYEKAFVSGMALQPSYQTYGVRFTVRTH